MTPGFRGFPRRRRRADIDAELPLIKPEPADHPWTGERIVYADLAPAPPMPGARRAPDAEWYVPDPDRPGRYLRLDFR